GDPLAVRACPVYEDVRAASRRGGPGRAPGDVDAKLESAAVAVEAEVEVGEQRGTGRGDLDIRVPIAERRAAGADVVQVGIHGPEIRRRRSETALPQVHLGRQPGQPVDRHAPVLAEGD